MTHDRMPGDILGWAVAYGQHLEHLALFCDRARAEAQAARLHGVLYPAVVGGPAEQPKASRFDPYGLDVDLDA